MSTHRILQLYGSINLSHTNVTADGLISSPLSNWEQVIVAFGQFSDEEVARISKAINLDVGGISPFYWEASY